MKPIANRLSRLPGGLRPQGHPRASGDLRRRRIPGTLRSKTLAALLLTFAFVAPTLAIDPPYQRQMERLSEIMGSLYYLQPLCDAGAVDWRAQAAELIELDEPDEDRRQRLAGAFNTGYTAFSRFHRQCTPASREALSRLLAEAQRLSREMHTRYAE